eukprot:jgi/Tetstr1/434285/TSEL_023392.t1
MDLCMVMDYCEGGDLYHYVQSRRKQGRKIEEDEAWLFMIQMMFALSYLHAKKILHRDLEESFELARTPIGTPFYMAPEIMEGRPYAFKSDVWALGCVMYEVLTGKPAFAAKNFPGVAMKVLRGHYEPISEDYSPELRDVVSKMLCNNSRFRSGSWATWRGAIPINTKHMTDHLQAIPEGESEGASSQNSNAAATATPADSPGAMEAQRSTTTQLSPLRAASFPELGEAKCCWRRRGGHSHRTLGLVVPQQLTRHWLAAWRGYAQGEQPELVKSPDAGTKDTASATLNVDDLTLSLGTTPKWSPNVSALADDSQGSGAVA